MSDRYEKGFSYRQKWVMVIIFCVLSTLLGYKVIFSSFSINITDLSFSDLLAIILALFSIAISLAFYFKASDTSNKFYNNTFKFTKDFGIMLGRIEVGFGERLKYLGELYSSIYEKVDKYPVIDKTKEEIKNRETTANEIKKDREKLLSDLLDKTKLETTAKQEILDQLKKKEEELLNERKEVDKLKRSLNEIENPSKVNWRQFFIPPSIKQLIRFALVYPLGEKFIVENSKEVINNKFQEIKKDFSQKALLDYINYGIIDEDFNLTENGINYLKSIVLEN
jgi:F0F1-type ATP synthase membrane subunit b/b'